MVVNCLTNHVYTSWGTKYSSFNWRPEWYAFIRMCNKEIREKSLNEYKHVAHIIYFLDNQILQKFGKDEDTTIRVRVRIVCGLINKIPYTIMSRTMKIEFMECIWDIYKKFKAAWLDYYFKYILELPF